MWQPDFNVEHLGLIPYETAWNYQKQLHAQVSSGEKPNTLLLLEHPKTITLGRRCNTTHLLHSHEAYRDMGYEVFQTERGGDVTYHGPGQLVGYPIFRIGRNISGYLRSLESVILRVLQTYGIEGQPSPGYAGVWLKSDSDKLRQKLCAIGIRVESGVTLHGFALNVNTNLEDFKVIVPCGLVGTSVTSLAKVLHRPVAMDEVSTRIIEAFRMEALPSEVIPHSSTCSKNTIIDPLVPTP